MLKLAKPQIPQSAISKVIEVLKSGNIAQGKFVNDFERTLEKYLCVKHVVVVSSGTAALHLSLMALNIKAGDEVIVPAFTFPATANVIEIVGAKPVFVDISLDDFCMDPSKLESTITKKTKAILPVHEFGQPAQMDRILTVAKKHRLLVIEDAACALGAEFNSKKVGTFGILGCFSFHPRKLITTGEGGAIVSNNGTLAHKIRALRNHGLANIGKKTDYLYAGLNYRMTDFQAVLGLLQLPNMEKDINHRIKMAAVYDRKLSNIDWIRTPKTFTSRKMVYQTYHILVNSKINRDALVKKLWAAGIETNLGAQALYCLRYYQKKYHHNTSDFPCAVRAFKQGLALPMGPHIRPDDIKVVSRKLQNIS